MPAFNRERFVGSAVNSLLKQTHRDFELVIVDDGSSDRTIEVAAASGDPRIRILRHEQNRGISEARNTALEAAKGRFIAWLDSDDLARPTRLAEQLRFLEANTEIAMIGASAGKVDENGRTRLGIRVPPLGHDEIRAWLLFRTAFQQSSVFGRAEVLKLHPYAPQLPVCEDIDVFIRVTQKHRVANLPLVLIDRRLHSGQAVRTRQQQILDTKKVQIGGLLDELGVQYGADDLVRHIMLGSGGLLGLKADRAYLEWAEPWLRRLLEANRASRLIEPSVIEMAVSYFWVRACRRAMKHGPKAWTLGRALRSPLSRDVLNRRGRGWLCQSLRLNAGL
jgi:glycosyltransferase involved in cell wall biosynthesis